MLNIYYGRESLNKDKFIFDNIEKGTILLVPDQYSLQAEKDAFLVSLSTVSPDPSILMDGRS